MAMTEADNKKRNSQRNGWLLLLLALLLSIACVFSSTFLALLGNGSGTVPASLLADNMANYGQDSEIIRFAPVNREVIEQLATEEANLLVTPQTGGELPAAGPTFIALVTATPTPSLLPPPPTIGPSATPGLTATGTAVAPLNPSATPTASPTVMPTPTEAVASPTSSVTPIITITPTGIPSSTPSPTSTNTPQPGATATNTPKPGATATNTPTSGPQATPTVTFTPSPTPTNNPTNTATPTSPSPVTATFTPTPSRTPTSQPTSTTTPTPTITSTPPSTNTPTSTPTSTIAPTPTQTNTPTATPTNTATPTPTPILPQALLVVADPAAMTGTDTAVQNRLVALGFVVTVVDDNVVDVFMAEASNVVFISNTCNPASGIANLATSRATIVLSHAGLYDEFGLTQVGDNGMVPGQTTIDIIDPGHPLAAGLSGTVTVLTNPNAIGWGVPENAALVGTLMGVPSNYTLFGYEAGAIVPGGFQVMRRRVGFFLSSATGATLTSEGWTLFDASILWAFNSP